MLDHEYYTNFDYLPICKGCANLEENVETLIGSESNLDDNALFCDICSNKIPPLYPEEQTTPRKFTLEISLVNYAFSNGDLYSELGKMLQILGNILSRDNDSQLDCNHYVFDRNGNKVGSYKFSTEASDYE